MLTWNKIKTGIVLYVLIDTVYTDCRYCTYNMTYQFHVVDEAVAVLPGLLLVTVQGHWLNILEDSVHYTVVQGHRLKILEDSVHYSAGTPAQYLRG